MSASFHQGCCACGQVRYRLQRQPLFVHCCHCRRCQRETGAAFAVNALVEADAIDVLSGTPESVVTPTDSGHGQRIVRCPQCRVALWSHYAYAGIGELVGFVRVGTLDDQEALPPDVHIYVESKLAWVSVPAHTTAVDRFYNARVLWPAASLERRSALRK